MDNTGFRRPTHPAQSEEVGIMCDSSATQHMSLCSCSPGQPGCELTL